MPFEWIDDDICEVLWVGRLTWQLKSIAGLNVSDFEDVRHRFDFLGCLVPGHADKVLVEALRALHVLRDALLPLVECAAKHHKLK